MQERALDPFVGRERLVIAPPELVENVTPPRQSVADERLGHGEGAAWVGRLREAFHQRLARLGDLAQRAGGRAAHGLGIVETPEQRFDGAWRLALPELGERK